MVKAQWPYLQFFDIVHNQVTADGLKALLKSSWPSLNVLKVRQKALSNDILKRIVRLHFSNGRLLVLSLEHEIGDSSSDCFFPTR